VRTTQRLAAFVSALFLTACAAQQAAPTPEIRRVLAPTGKLRVGVYPGSPTSMVRNPVSGEVAGVSVDLGTELAKRLGVPYEQVEYQRIAEVIDGLKSGAVDFAISNATPARAKDVDFTQPLLAIELGYLVPPGSPISSVADVDRAGVRIGVTQGSTSQSTLPRELKNANVVPTPTLKVGIEMLSQRNLDAFATNKAILFEMSDSLPGSRVLEGRWGVEYLAIAVPKGRDQGMIYVRQFVDDVDSQGLVTRAAERAGLRGTVKASSR
jgi:polar amino acid transport system substrate-binding protein